MQKIAPTATAEAGYLYVLIHPSNPNLFKVGKTTRHPEARLAEHNSRFEEYAGKVVKETGQKWELQTYISVPDTYWAEAVFWGATGLADIPYRGGVEVACMDLACLKAGLEAAKKAGVRPPAGPVKDYVYANRAWMNKRLKGRSITLLGHVRSKSGKSNFRCGNGHEWRTVPYSVAAGEGCPHCGVGKRTLEEIRQTAGDGGLYLLVHPDKPGFIKIERTYNAPGNTSGDGVTDGWQVHRRRSVEDPEFAESIAWEMLGHPQPVSGEPLEIDLCLAEEMFRALHYRLESEIALIEKAKDAFK